MCPMMELPPISDHNRGYLELIVFVVIIMRLYFYIIENLTQLVISYLYPKTNAAEILITDVIEP
jgi:hypothetical protein